MNPTLTVEELYPESISIEAPSAETGSSAGTANQDKTTSDAPEPSLSEEATTPAWVLESPPDLVVSTENQADCVTAIRYGYTWQKKLEGDQMTSVIACGPHPLDGTGESDYATLYTAFSTGSLPPWAKGPMSDAMMPVFYLDFGEIPPETVTASRWPAEYIGHASEHYDDGEKVTVDNMDGFILLPQGDGEFVYEVHADWGEVGCADYVFLTLPQVREE